MVLMGCYRSGGSFDPFLEVFTRLSHFGWYALQSMEEIVSRRLNNTLTKDSKTAVSLALEYNPSPVIRVKGSGFDSLAMVLAEAGSLSKR